MSKYFTSFVVLFLLFCIFSFRSNFAHSLHLDTLFIVSVFFLFHQKLYWKEGACFGTRQYSFIFVTFCSIILPMVFLVDLDWSRNQFCRNTKLHQPLVTFICTLSKVQVEFSPKWMLDVFSSNRCRTRNIRRGRKRGTVW